METQIQRLLLRGEHIPWSIPMQCLQLGEWLDIPNWGEIVGILFIDLDNIGLSVDISDPRIRWLVYLNCLNAHKNKIIPFLERTFSAKINLTEYQFIIGNYIVEPLPWEQALRLLAEMYQLDWDTLRPPKATNSKVEEMRKRLAETKAAVQKAKMKQGKAITVESMIVGICAKDPSLNFLNIYELTYYQFMKTVHGIHKVDDYDTSIQSLLAGADPKKVKPKHWMED